MPLAPSFSLPRIPSAVNLDQLSQSLPWMRLVPLLGLALCALPARAAVQNTATTLTVTQPGDTAPHAATLQATVTANGQPLRRGIVSFCDASTRSCLDLALLGTAAITGDGTATLRKVLAPGTHSVYAVFNPTTTNGRSQSAIATIIAPASIPTAISIGKTSAPGSFSVQDKLHAWEGFTPGSVSVQARVTAQGAAPLAGPVSLVLNSNSNVLNTASLSRAAISTSFGPLATYSIPSPGFYVSHAQVVSIADFNGDGLPDVALELDGPASAISILLNDPAHPGQFLPGQTVVAGLALRNLLAADLNGDGILDLTWNTTAINQMGNYYYPDEIAFGDPAHPGQFLSPITIQSTAFFTAVADMNGDGLLDLVGTDGENPYVLFNDTQYPGQFYDFATFPLTTGAFAFGVSVADMNADGLLDLVFSYANGTQSGNDAAVMLNDPANPGHLLAPTHYPEAISGAGIVLADFNHDGLPDMATTSFYGSVAVLLNNPDAPGHLLTPSVYQAGNPNSAYSLQAANFRSTRTLDLVVGNDLLPADPAHPGHFLSAEALPFPAQTYPPYPFAADLNADGYADNVFVNPSQLPPMVLGTQITRVTQTSTAAFPSITLNGARPELAHVAYAGAANFLPSVSCSIDLSVVIPKDPSLTSVSAIAISPTSESIASSSSGTEEYVSYGTSAALGSVIQSPAPGSPIVLSNLQPGTTYFYQVTTVAFASGCFPLVTASPVATFTTASSESAP